MTLAAVFATAPVSVNAQEVTQLPARDRSVALEVDPVYSVGGIAGEDWQIFGENVQVGFDGNGGLHILDGDNFRVLALSETGALSWDAGREGGGPGEFGMPMSMAVGADGSATVYDLGHQAFVQFGPDGSYIDQVAHGLDQGIPGREMLGDPTGGVIYSSAGSFSFNRNQSGAAILSGGGEREPIRRALAGDRDGVLYEAWRLPTAPPEEMETESGSVGFRMSMSGMRAFEPDLYYAPLSNGDLIVVDTVDYAVKVVGSDGTLRRVLRRAIEPRAVGRSEREAEKKRQLDALEESGGPQVRVLVRGGSAGASGGPRTPNQSAMREMFEGRIESMVFADYIPVLTEVRVDPWSDQIWVRRAGRRIGENGPVDVLTAQGEYLGTLDASVGIPAAFGPNGLVAYIDVDEFDVNTVRVERIRSLR